MVIEYHCPHCKQILRIPNEYLGQTGKCTKCGGEITVTLDTSTPGKRPPPIPKVTTSFEDLGESPVIKPEVVVESPKGRRRLQREVSDSPAGAKPVVRSGCIILALSPFLLVGGCLTLAGLAMNAADDDAPTSSSTNIRPASPGPALAVTTQPEPTDPPGTVYSFEGGSKYHTKDCTRIAGRTDLYPSTPEEAWDAWFEPCAECKPEGYEAFAEQQRTEQQALQQQPQPTQQQRRQPAASTTAETVYITDTGAKYHRSGCRTLKQSKYPVSLFDATSQGYMACGICY